MSHALEVLDDVSMIPQTVVETLVGIGILTVAFDLGKKEDESGVGLAVEKLAPSR